LAVAVKRHLGGCLCGAVRFEATGPALKPHTCSCKTCQRHTGALTACWVEFPREAVVWTGTGGRPATYRSSDFSSRAFCPACGSTLGAIDDKPVVALLLGAFDKPAAKELRPTAHSYRGGRPRWWRVEVVGDDPEASAQHQDATTAAGAGAARRAGSSARGSGVTG
jgi:hypothetical protein